MTDHWTNQSLKDFAYRVASDFVAQLEDHLQGVSRDELAERLSLTKGRVSQVLNSPGNFRIVTAVQFARALGLKVSLVAYSDNDPTNQNGPINSGIFEQCWSEFGKPTEFHTTGWDSVETTSTGEGKMREWNRVDHNRINTFDVNRERVTGSWQLAGER